MLENGLIDGDQSSWKISLSFILKVPRRIKMRILRMTMSHSQIQKKNNFQLEDQISTVYKNSSFQPEHYFLGRGFFYSYNSLFQPVIEISYISHALIFKSTYCDQTNIRKGYPYKQFQPLISDTRNYCSPDSIRRRSSRIPCRCDSIVEAYHGI